MSSGAASCWLRPGSEKAVSWLRKVADGLLKPGGGNKSSFANLLVPTFRHPSIWTAAFVGTASVTEPCFVVVGDVKMANVGHGMPSLVWRFLFVACKFSCKLCLSFTIRKSFPCLHT